MCQIALQWAPILTHTVVHSIEDVLKPEQINVSHFTTNQFVLFLLLIVQTGVPGISSA